MFRPQFRLRTLLFALTATACILAPLAWWNHESVEQAGAVDRLNLLGAKVFYDYQLACFNGRIVHDGDAILPETVILKYFGTNHACKVAGVWSPRLLDEERKVSYQMGDRDAQLLGPLTHTRFLLIDSESLTDDGARIVERLTKLEDIGVNSPQITDATVYRLLRHKRLTALSLGGTSVTDDGIHSLTKIPNLMVLNLSYTHITGDSLRSIGQLANLVELHLRGNTIGTGHISQLKELCKLKTLDVRETGVSDSEVAQLNAALPEVTIYH